MRVIDPMNEVGEVFLTPFFYCEFLSRTTLTRFDIPTTCGHQPAQVCSGCSVWWSSSAFRSPGPAPITRFNIPLAIQIDKDPFNARVDSDLPASTTPTYCCRIFSTPDVASGRCGNPTDRCWHFYCASS